MKAPKADRCRFAPFERCELREGHDGSHQLDGYVWDASAGIKDASFGLEDARSLLEALAAFGIRLPPELNAKLRAIANVGVSNAD